MDLPIWTGSVPDLLTDEFPYTEYSLRWLECTLSGVALASDPIYPTCARMPQGGEGRLAVPLTH